VKVAFDTETKGLYPWYENKDFVSISFSHRIGRSEILYLGPKARPIELVHFQSGAASSRRPALPGRRTAQHWLRRYGCRSRLAPLETYLTPESAHDDRVMAGRLFSAQQPFSQCPPVARRFTPQHA
jgi:hypothetical protein